MKRLLVLALAAGCGGSSAPGPIGQGSISPAPFAIRSTLALATTNSSGFTDVAIIYSDLPIDCAHAKDEITLPPPQAVNTFTLAPPGSAFQAGTFQRTGGNPTQMAFQQHLAPGTGEQEPLVSSTGTVTITAVGATVSGTFSAQMIHTSDNSDAGTYTGTFDAPFCAIHL